MTGPLSPEREQQIPAEIRLAQYSEQATWSNPTYGHGNEQALHRVALELQAELDRLRAELAQARDNALAEVEEKLTRMLGQMCEDNPRLRGVSFATGVLKGLRHDPAGEPQP